MVYISEVVLYIFYYVRDFSRGDHFIPVSNSNKNKPQE